MREQPPSKAGNAQQLKSRRIASTVLCALLIAGIARVEPTAAVAQTTSPDLQPPVGMHTTSPLATRSAGIPLGSTEIATPGISPVAPSFGKARHRSDFSRRDILVFRVRHRPPTNVRLRYR
jgi:hypothetical protein